jgi:hypothetical protein
MPDAPLRRAADAGTLRNPGVLAAQVRRMLRDPRSRSLAEQFGGQWLQFRALESLTRNRERFPDFDDDLRMSMRGETEHFIEYVIQEDRSILDFLDAKYTFLNERLARHYGIAGVSGPGFRRVELVDTPRAGVLTHASVLTVSSYATRTSPVLRGKWILDNLLNAPPPDPPPDVPNLNEASIGTAASLREQLEAHRHDPTVRLLPSPDGSARLRPRELRRRRRLADHGRQLPDRRERVPARWRRVHGARGAAPRARRPAPGVRAVPHVEADDYALGRGLDATTPDGQGDRGPAAGAAVPVLGAGPRDREQPAVPAATTERRASRSGDATEISSEQHDPYGRHLPRRTFLRGLGALIALPRSTR